MVADDAGRRLTSAFDGGRGLHGRIAPVPDVEPGENGYESATNARAEALRSERKARVALSGDDGAGRTSRTRSAASAVAVDAVRRREPDLDRFTAALLALALHELDQERNGG